MGFVSYGMLVSIDGFVAAADGDLSGFPAPGPALHRVFNDGQRAAALSVYGSRMWRTMEYWGRPDPEWDEVAEDFARAWVETPKIVFSSTVTEVPEGVTLIASDAVEAFRRIRAETEGAIEVSGPALAASLGAAGLIDEYRLYTQPFVLGGGTPYFAAGFRPRLRFLDCEPLPEGAVLMRYAPR
ncbi:dihydrofolate reductase family protein [Rathayibacter sp. VKM Ac-2760]|uniref:dihydrofolate reductase family protein n=1 Tax=Rathayibacter sp. VKM Ac-2760 TaxID=2609253 RepID=UPI0013199786|nr:dihydrofolate reductase family protein [Rathayibacter sp. VKM Ac-2760]QHC60510.1 dihydrofolate reductase [Rathayibacter sp. VKM Ac-2760]